MINFSFQIQHHWSSNSLVKHWTLDTPSEAASKLDHRSGMLLLTGWVIPQEQETPHIAIRYAGNTRCYPLNVLRPDVIEEVLKEPAADHPLLMCGFDLRAPLVDRIQLGFEKDGLISWAVTLTRAQPS